MGTSTNVQVKDAMLLGSLMRHRGDMLTPSEMEAFMAVAGQVSTIGFTDSMVCYNEEARHVTFDLLTPSGLILHLTQYFEKPTDQVAYSVERNGKFVCAGHLPADGFSSQLSEIIHNAEATEEK